MPRRGLAPPASLPRKIATDDGRELAGLLQYFINVSRVSFFPMTSKVCHPGMSRVAGLQAGGSDSLTCRVIASHCLLGWIS
ncbi:hypothetical protein E2C01_000194 [Portunus trituberculatus]|uniref:Uncharacterized protein n=1 Tax=Portunus trituberculatus TaxID=210409 RepID=A0A5B7CEJ9_PORTR|nr:hypothetical protein [Portunus trituberculatus]